MKRLLAATVLLAAGLLSAATVDNVSVRQRWPWSQKVDITYNLTTDKPQQIDVAVFQGDARVPMPDAAFSGDRHNVASGARPWWLLNCAVLSLYGMWTLLFTP